MFLKNRAVVMFFVLLAGVAFSGLGFAEDAEAAAAESSSLKVKIVGQDGKSPVSGAKILIYHLSTEKTYTSPPSGAKGLAVVSGLPYGYFDLAIETPDGLFVANQVVNIPPSGKSVLNISLADFAASSNEADKRDFPGVDTTPQGVASVRQKLTGRAFWGSPKGIAILAGGGAVILAVAAGGGSSSNDPFVSPSTP